MKFILGVLVWFSLYSQVAAQDQVLPEDTLPPRTYYCLRKNWNFEVFGFSANNDIDKKNAVGYGFHSFWGYQFPGLNVGVGTGIEIDNADKYIPFFFTIQGQTGADDVRYFLYFEYGYLAGQYFGNTYETGSFANIGGGIKKFISNYQTLYFSLGYNYRQIDKATTIRDAKKSFDPLLKIGYSFY